MILKNAAMEVQEPPFAPILRPSEDDRFQITTRVKVEEDEYEETVHDPILSDAWRCRACNEPLGQKLKISDKEYRPLPAKAYKINPSKIEPSTHYQTKTGQVFVAFFCSNEYECERRARKHLPPDQANEQLRVIAAREAERITGEKIELPDSGISCKGPNCGRIFNQLRYNQAYCSDTCRKNAHLLKHPRKTGYTKGKGTSKRQSYAAGKGTTRPTDDNP